jgi:DNA-binding GntR family transcriptional regulator
MYTTRMRAVRTSRADGVYDYLRQRIVRGELGGGEVLAEEVIAEECGVSRTPVREALRRLQGDGLVSAIARRGLFVREFTSRDVVELFQLREAIEGYALLTVGATIPRSLLQQIRERQLEWQQSPGPPTTAWNPNVSDSDPSVIDLHRVIVDALHNGRMTELLDRGGLQMASVTGQIHGLREVVWTQVFDESRREIAVAQHIEIIDRLLEDDRDRAHSALLNHLRTAQETTLSFLASSHRRGRG